MALAAMLVATPCRAQSDPPRLAAGVGVGTALPWHGDFDFNALAWNVDVRAATRRHLLVEGVANGWRHTESTIRINQTISGPNGVIGTVGRLEERSSRSITYVGVNGLLTGGGARVRLTGGGGAGLMFFHRRFSQASFDCTGTVSCQSFSTQDTNASIAAQGAAGAEVQVVRRLGVFGQLRVSIPFDDPGSGDTSITIGVRIH